MKLLNDIYNQIKFSTILTTGRSGSDYLHGCLDNVPGVMTLGGKFFYYSFCDQLQSNAFQEKNL